MKRCKEFNVSFVRGLGSAVSPENNEQRRVTWLLSCVECAVDRSGFAWFHCNRCLVSPQLARKGVVNEMCLLRRSVVGRGEFCSLRDVYYYFLLVFSNLHRLSCGFNYYDKRKWTNAMKFKLLASMSWNSARIKGVDTMLRMHIHIAPPVMTTVVAAWGERRTYHWRLEQRQSSYDWPLWYWSNRQIGGIGIGRIDSSTVQPCCGDCKRRKKRMSTQWIAIS